MLKTSLLNKIYISELALFGLIVTGVLPRSVSILLAVSLILYTLLASLENAVVLFVMSIPLFLALPVTASFDNFNIWRILAAIIFLKWFFEKSIMYYVLSIKGWFKSCSYNKPSAVAAILFLFARKMRVSFFEYLAKTI